MINQKVGNKCMYFPEKLTIGFLDKIKNTLDIKFT